MELDSSLIPEIVPTFGLQGELSIDAANKIGLTPGTKSPIGLVISLIMHYP